jgi:hypothetical protein
MGGIKRQTTKRSEIPQATHSKLPIRVGSVDTRRRAPSWCICGGYIPPYIVDFYAPQLKLVLEMDEDTHDEQKEYDARRDNFLKNKGYEILHFTNDAIHQGLEGALEILRYYCVRLTPPPTSTLKEQGGGIETRKARDCHI